MKKIFLITFLSIAYMSVQAQTEWTYDMYKKYDHTNFRNCKLFNEKIDLKNPDYPLLNATIFFMTNEQRIKYGKEPIEYHPYCEIAAYNHSKKMVEQDFFSHTNNNEIKRSRPKNRAELAGISNPGSYGENIAMRTGVEDETYSECAEQLMEQWMNSAGHKRNILNSLTVQGGCGAYFNEDEVYATQYFKNDSKIIEKTQVDKLPNLRSGKAPK